jgi:N-acyl amino acid synthase of PEP-CTERM/exosortase system
MGLGGQMNPRLDAEHSFIDLFNKYFEVVPADSPKKKLECYRLRYQVYCKEGVIRGFSPENYPNGLEYDQYDERSVHSLLMHKPTKSVAGTVRVILPDRNKPEVQFPLEKFGSHSFYADIIPLESLPRLRVGEISRLILAPKFRGRQGENQFPYGMAENSEYPFQPEHRRKSSSLKTGSDDQRRAQRRTFPHAILGLLVAVAQISVQYNLNYLYVGMEPVCARLLRTFGIHFTPISPIIDYYGPCRGYLGSIPDIGKTTYLTSQQLWNLLTRNGALYPRPT